MVDFCLQHLGIKLDPSNIERSHRLGRFSQNKNRPIIVKFLRFKDKESILGSGSKLKGSDFAVRPDLSEAVRLARSKLFLYAQPQNVPFKVRFNKLYMAGKCFSYDAATDSVMEART